MQTIKWLFSAWPPLNPLAVTELVLATIGSVCVSFAACATDSSGAYLGGNFGRAHNTYDTGTIDAQVAGVAAASGDTVSVSRRSVQRMSDGWWVDAGYLFNPYVGIEAQFLHLGEFKYQTTGTIHGKVAELPLSTETEVTSHGPALALLLRLPFTEAFEADLRVGDYYGKATANALVTAGSTGSPGSTSKSTSSLLVAIGAAYTLAAHWSLRGDFVRVNKTGDSATTGTFSVNLVTLGVSYTF